MDDSIARSNKKRLHTFWLMFFVPVAVGIYYFYSSENADSSVAVDPSSPQQQPAVDENISALQELVDQSKPDAESAAQLEALILQADKTIADADQILARSNFESDQPISKPSAETIRLREELEKLTPTTL